MGNIANLNITPSQVSGRLATWHRLMEEAGLTYTDLQAPIDDPEFRKWLVSCWQTGCSNLVSQPSYSSAYPAVGKVFTLTIDGDAEENQPMEILRYFGYNSEGWKYKGLRVGGKQICRFKLVNVGLFTSLKVVRGRLEPYGKKPGGQWMKAFKVAYPQHDGNGSIGIADASWISPDGFDCFPAINTAGRLYFDWDVIDHSGDWRWLVAVE